jgi:hypothetical protein
MSMKREFSCLAVVALALVFTGCAAAHHAAPIPMLAIPADWKAVEQADLAKDLRDAKPLKVENLGTAVLGVDDPADAGRNVVPHADGKDYDALLWYRKDYMRQTTLYVIDTSTGKVTVQQFPELEKKSRPEQAFGWWGVLGLDGKFYGAAPDWLQDGKGGVMNIYQYDSTQKKVSLYKTIKGYGGESSPLVVAPDGWIYGSGTWCGEGNTHRIAGAYGFNPATGETRDFGPVGPAINGTGYAPFIGACDTHLYVACGKIPWYLVAIDLKTGEQKVILEAPEGGDLMAISSSQSRYFGGAAAWIEKGIAAPKQFFWLYHGKAIAKAGTEAPEGWAMDDTCPWPKEMQARNPLSKMGPPPETYIGQMYPDGQDRAVFYWRPAADKGNDSAWRKVTLEGVKKYPLTLHRFCTLPDGRIFGTGENYKGRFLFDPATGKITYLGRGGGSMYGLTVLGDKLYWSGYDCARIFEYDPDRPWNLEKGGPPNAPRVSSTDPAAFGKDINPRRVHEKIDVLFEQTRVKKMLSATTAADGRVYFGGKGQRDYAGGGLSWYDPKTGQYGGMWKPFDGKPIGYVTTAHEAADKDIRTPGRYVVIGTQSGNVFIYDTSTHTLLEDKTFTPVTGARYSGPLIEVAPGRMLGVTWAAGGQKAGGVLYGVSVPEGKVFFTKAIPWGVPFDWGQGIGLSDFCTGPDGFLWATLTDGSAAGAIVKIDPRDAKVQVLGRIEPLGQMVFSGKDAYLTGTTEIRCLKGIAAP